MKKSSLSSSNRTIANFSFVTYLNTVERARVYYSNSKDCYYLSYSFLKKRYLLLPLGRALDFCDDLEVITAASHFIYDNFQKPFYV